MLLTVRDSSSAIAVKNARLVSRMYGQPEDGGVFGKRKHPTPKIMGDHWPAADRFHTDSVVMRAVTLERRTAFVYGAVS